MDLSLAVTFETAAAEADADGDGRIDFEGVLGLVGCTLLRIADLETVRYQYRSWS